MYQFVKFSDLGPFTDIVHSNAKFVNAPVGMLLDRQGRVIGHRMAPLATRRFGTFQGTAGEDPNLGGVAAPAPVAAAGGGEETLFGVPEGFAPIAMLPDEPEPEAKDIFEQTVGEMFGEQEEGLGEFGFEQSIIDEIVREELSKESVRRRAMGALLTAARDIRAVKAGVKRTGTRKKKRAVKKAALAGIKASNKGDDITAERKAMIEAKEAGLSPSEVAAIGRATKRAVRKHMDMEDKEAGAIASEVVEGKHAAGVKSGPPGGKVTSGGRGRGRPAGSKTATSPNPLLSGKTQKQLKAIGKSLGFKSSYFKNRSVSIDRITSAASKGGTPLGLVIEAFEGKTPMPTSVLQAVQQMENDRRARGRSKSARGTSAVRGKTRQPRRAESPAAFVANPSARGRISYSKSKK